jgi:hypothetical protein
MPFANEDRREIMSNHFVRPDVQALLDMLNSQPGPKMHELSATEARGMMTVMGAMAEEELGESRRNPRPFNPRACRHDSGATL